MRLSRLLPTVLLLLLASFPALAQVNDTYVIPASSNSPGDQGTTWATRFSVFNPHFDYPLVVSITFLPRFGLPGIEELVEVPANSSAWSDNLLLDLYGITNGSGSLLVATFPEDNPGVPNDVLSRSFLVTSETYNDDPSGTYGQTIPGVWTGLMDIDTDGISAVSHGIRHIPGQGWRTNVGAVNLGRCQVTLWVTVYDADGNLVTEAPMNLPMLGFMQDTLPVQIDAGTVEFSVQDPCAADDDLYAVVFPYTSTIDQYSGDPTYQSPPLLASPGSIFAAKAGAALDPTKIGKKIDSAYARGIRSQAERRGKATLTRTPKGWKIGK